MPAGLQWRKPGFKKSYVKGNIHRDRRFSKLSIVNGHKKSNNRGKYSNISRHHVQMRERNWQIGKEKRKLTLPW
jgi:hypothetical protein